MTKKKNIFKFISLLGISSVITTTIASCSNNNNRSIISDENQVNEFFNNLKEEDFVLTDNQNTIDKTNTSVKNIDANHFTLKDDKLISPEWTKEISIVSKDPSKGEVVIKVVYSNRKSNQSKTTKNITIRGFQTEEHNNQQTLSDAVNKLNANSFEWVDNNQKLDIATKKASEVKNNIVKLKANAIDAKLLANWTVSYQLTNANDTKGSLDLTVKFSQQSQQDITKKITIHGFKSISLDIANKILVNTKINEDQKTTVKALKLDTAGFKNLVTLNKEVTSNGVKTNGFNELFTKIFNDSAKKLTQDKDGVDSSDLYLSGSFKVQSAYKENKDDWQLTYHLVSKDDNNPVLIKSKKNANIEIAVDNLVIKDLLPDSIHVFVSSVFTNETTFDAKNRDQSNVDAYKELAKTDSTYKYDAKTNQISINIEGDKPYTINPIKIPYIGANNTEQVLFKVQYIFDGTKIYISDIFGTKLRVKKVLTEKDKSSVAISSEELTKIDSKLSIYWLNTERNPRDIDGGGDFFWKGGLDENLITSTEKSLGIPQLLHVTGNTKFIINDDKGTNYLLYPRISYKEAKDRTNYLWLNAVTILHISAKENKPAESTAKPS
ncbi:lipoprotein 17-related variable surface protein [Mycoplasma sp. E35C]|uniref:lipoprotein 17-related variable surface protein n=1 Tax=Mycoplasma sp. E35C TaxID=2801918 RepID=UPI001CA40EC7|nr:lipoprotein 17-related variable surface protein [Mycoplasma sp. E35C]QZX48873.1 hypothetical protein JJE79_02330 [Mycoplasma sp. E35C]